MDDLDKLRKRLHSAKQRARYWSGVPTPSGFGYNPSSGSACDVDANYEMALDDCAAIADEIERVTGKRPATPDPKRDFNAHFAQVVLPKIASPKPWNSKDTPMETIEIGKGESITLDPLAVGREAPELLVDLIAQIGEVVLDAEQKLALREVIVGLPHGATMRDLIAALKAKEAAELGMSLEQYEALTPLFLALQAMQAKGAYSHLFPVAGKRPT